MRKALLYRIYMHGVAAAALALAASACGDDTTGPSSRPDVSGIYQVELAAEATVCDPPSALDVLDVVTGDYRIQGRLRVEDLGEQVRVTLLSIAGGTVGEGNEDVGTLDPDGAFRLEVERSDQVTFEGRTFFTQVSGYSEGRFDRDTVPITFAASGPATEVLREGSASAPVFATCTQTQSVSGTRTSE